MASNGSLVNFNIHRNFKLAKSLTTTMANFDGKSEKFEMFADPFPTRLKIHNQLTKDDKIKYFYSLMRDDMLQMLKNVSSSTQ